MFSTHFCGSHKVHGSVRSQNTSASLQGIQFDLVGLWRVGVAPLTFQTGKHDFGGTSIVAQKDLSWHLIFVIRNFYHDFFWKLPMTFNKWAFLSIRGTHVFRPNSTWKAMDPFITSYQSFPTSIALPEDIETPLFFWTSNHAWLVIYKDDPTLSPTTQMVYMQPLIRLFRWMFLIKLQQFWGLDVAHFEASIYKLQLQYVTRTSTCKQQGLTNIPSKAALLSGHWGFHRPHTESGAGRETCPRHTTIWKDYLHVFVGCCCLFWGELSANFQNWRSHKLLKGTASKKLGSILSYLVLLFESLPRIDIVGQCWS